MSTTFINISGITECKAVGSERYQESYTKFEDHMNGNYEVPAVLYVDPVSRKVVAAPADSTEIPDNAQIIEPDYQGKEADLWVLTREIGFINRHSVRISIIPLDNMFLVGLHRGAFYLRMEDDQEPILLNQGYSGNSLDEFTFRTPDELPAAPWKTLSQSSVISTQFYYYNYGREEASSTPWNLETINPSFYEELEQAERIRESQARAARDRELARKKAEEEILAESNMVRNMFSGLIANQSA